MAFLNLCLILIWLSTCMANTNSRRDIKVVESKKSLISEIKFIIGNCSFKDCVIECRNTNDLYENINQAILDSGCEKDIQLIINNQRFHNHTLKNDWLPSNKTINGVIVTSGDLSFIHNEAFNCFDFIKTHILVFENVGLTNLSNGVLLGLSQLRTLQISGNVDQIDRCFFQPVQTSLTQLSINGKLVISGSDNIFGISSLPKLYALDLGGNVITGSIEKCFFDAIPNIAFLTLSNSKITSIDENAFDDIAKTLRLLDLSNNLLISINYGLIENILQWGLVRVYLLGNDWLCDCNLQPLINLYTTYENVFGDIPYCKYPSNVYGVLFSNMKFDSKCSEIISPGESSTDIIRFDSKINGIFSTTEKVRGTHLRMRCLNIPSEGVYPVNEEAEYFLFAQPSHEFELMLLENNSAKLMISTGSSAINVVWFSDALETFMFSMDGRTMNYNCDTYTNPYLIVNDLKENFTYTFCLVPIGSESITPFNCLPLYVPKMDNEENDIWISLDEKHMTLGMVCLIFICSMIVGGVIAYVGIRAFPELLEGSGNVLIVKSADKTCSVSTITNGDHMSETNLKKKNSLKQNLLSRPSSININSPAVAPLATRLQKTNKEFIGETDDYYELPCVYEKVHECRTKCISNNYSASPLSPPPLPKYN